MGGALHNQVNIHLIVRGKTFLCFTGFIFFAHDPVERRATHPETLGDVADVVVAVGHERLDHHEVLFGDLDGAAAGLATGTSGLEARHRAFTDEVAFELSQAREEVEDELAGGRAGIDLLGERDEPDTASFEVVHDAHEIRQRAAEAIETPHHQSIPLAQCLESVRQLGPISVLAARVFLVDGFTAVSLECIDLEIKDLIIRRYSGVADMHSWLKL
jgi:hypothetical protein